MHSLPLWLLPLAPVVAALIAGVSALTRRAEQTAPYLTIVATALSGVTAWEYLPDRGQSFIGHTAANWLTVPGGFQVALGVHLDPLAWAMVAVVCTVSLLVQVYSIGYMQGESGYARYFAFLGLFTASMLGLVGAVSSARLAAGRDGRPDARIGADPRGDDGCGGRLYGGAAIPDLCRLCRRDGDGADHRGLYRAHGGDDRAGADGHQESAGLLH